MRVKCSIPTVSRGVMGSVVYLLWVMWLCTRCPAARADIRDSSPARTVAQTTLANWRALSPGPVRLAPCTPSIYNGHAYGLIHTLIGGVNTHTHCTCRQDCCGARLVPPPTVPSSIEGMVQLIYRSSPSGPTCSIRVIQLLLPTVWAGS